ncbi:hypothetical protein QJQ45_024139, partial [Haematococcus lacustris]
HPRHWPRNSLFGTVFDPLHVILPPLGSTSHSGVASRLGPLLPIVLHCVDDLISFAQSSLPVEELPGDLIASQWYSPYACMRVATGEVDWWPEAFPCRAAFAAVGLATHEYFPGKHGAQMPIVQPSPPQPSLIWCHGA